jgi:hypothetical protein
MTNTGDRLFDGVPDRRKDVELRKLINAAEEAYTKMRAEKTPEAAYFQSHLRERLYNLRAELSEMEHVA